MSDVLFQSFKLGDYTLPNRVVMAPLTRSRADEHGNVTEMTATYYAQRAGAGLIISEATNISPQALGYAWTPGIYTAQHVASWKNVTDAVHKAGGRIFCQLWHVGRISHPTLQPDGALPVAPSAICPDGQAFTYKGMQPHVTPRALGVDEMPGIISDYKHAARCAMDAGFDGVEIHAANGYLIDQFLRDKTNKRDDEYGGSIENRCRLLVQVTDAVTEIWGGARTGVRFGPASHANDISDSDPKALFTHAVSEMDRYNLSYIHIIEGQTGGARDVEGGFDYHAEFSPLFKGAYMANNGYDHELAEAAVAGNKADLVAIGRPYIANPDLVERYKRGAPLNTPDPDTFYGGGAEGYTDYPALEDKN